MAPTASTVRNLGVTAAYLAAHPRGWRGVPEWLRDRKATPFALRKPWWPYPMIGHVSQQLTPGARVFEFGGGGSSLWLADHGADLTVVEHDESWAEQLAKALPASVKLVIQPAADTGRLASEGGPGFFDGYVTTIDDCADGELDLVIVDGRCRTECAEHAIPKVRRGGMLLLDDSDRKRYRKVPSMLRGWTEFTVRGLKPGASVPATTSVWRAP